MEELWRRLAPQVLGALVRRFDDFGEAEDAVQEALLAASRQWPVEGVPRDPRAWLIRVASRRLIDVRRGEVARARREVAAAARVPSDAWWVPAADVPDVAGRDDTLALLVLCCHPVLPVPSQVALTLRAVGGLSTVQIARAFVVPEASMGQRISRAKQRVREAGARFVAPGPGELAGRVPAVLHVLYLVFNEGYTASAGADLHRVELSGEAIRLARLMRAALPGDGEVAGLLALMLLTDARRSARTGPDGVLVPLEEQDRRLWSAGLIAEGVGLVEAALAGSRVGPFQLQAAIAAVHAQARVAAETDWAQILVLYRMLERLAPNPVVTLNRAVAAAMVHGPGAGLAVLDSVASRLGRHHRWHAVRGHLLERSGEAVAARESYLLAARLTTSLPEQRYLAARARGLGGG